MENCLFACKHTHPGVSGMCKICPIEEQEIMVLVRKLYLDVAGWDSNWAYMPLKTLVNAWNTKFCEFDKTNKETYDNVIQRLHKEIDHLHIALDSYRDANGK